MLKKLITAVLCMVVAAAATAPVAGAAARGGRPSVMAGHTAQGRSVRVAIGRRSVDLKHFKIRLRCRGGYVLIVDESGFERSRLRRNRRIHDHQVGSTDDVYVRGRLGNHHLHGAIRVRDRLGRHRCDSHWVRFSVRR
jgi:hypothetical protein